MLDIKSVARALGGDLVAGDVHHHTTIRGFRGTDRLIPAVPLRRLWKAGLGRTPDFCHRPGMARSARSGQVQRRVRFAPLMPTLLAAKRLADERARTELLRKRIAARATNSKRDCIGHRAALARSAVEVRGLGSRVCALPPRPLPDVRILSNHESDSRGAVPSTDDPASAVGSVRRRRASLPPHIESSKRRGVVVGARDARPKSSISPELTSRSPVDAACHDAVATIQSALTLHGEVNVPIRNLSRPMRVGRPTRRARAPRPARFGLTRTVPCRHAGSFSAGWRRSLAFHSALDPRLWMYCRGGRTLAILRQSPDAADRTFFTPAEAATVEAVADR